MKKLMFTAVALTMVVLPVTATAQASTPAGVVRSAYTCVFSKTCSDTTARSYLTPSLRQEFTSADALEKRCRCEVIDASPWVDAQVGPAAFSVGAASVHGDRGSVPVRFSGGKAGAYTLTVDVQHTATGWAISDIRQRNGQSTAAMIAANIASTEKSLDPATAKTPDDVLFRVERWQSSAELSGSYSATFADVKPYLTPEFAQSIQPKAGQIMNPFTLSSVKTIDWESAKAKTDGNTATAVVRLQFHGGARSELLYHFERTASGWKVGGVTSLR